MIEKYWFQYSKKIRPDLKNVFLAPNSNHRKTKDGDQRKYHIWNGIDALCNRYQKHPEIRKYYHIADYDEDSVDLMYYNNEVCKNCLKIYDEERNKMVSKHYQQYEETTC